MRSVEISAGGSPEAPLLPEKGKEQQPSSSSSSSLAWPFGIPLSFSSIGGPTYLTAQTVVQQVAYALSDKLFTYSPDTFDLDVAVKQWAADRESNANGYPTTVQAMQTRQGAGALALGYIFSKDFDLRKRHIPQSVVASSATLQYMRPALEQLSLLYSVANPFVAHVAAVDHMGGGSDSGSPAGVLASDYSNALSLAEELGFGLVSSASVHESQHMALFSTLLAHVLPSLHIYDGVRVGRETTRIIDALDQRGLHSAYSTVTQQLSGSEYKHLDVEGKTMALLKAFNEELGTEYRLFDYHGHPEATSVLVAFGTVEASLAGQIANSLAQSGARVGALTVRVYRPFVEEEFLKALPSTTRVVGVLGQVQDDLSVQEDGVHAALYNDVLAALTFGGNYYDSANSPKCVEIKYSPSQSWNTVDIAAAFQRIVDQPLLQDTENSILDTSSIQQYTFWDLDDSATSSTALALGRVFAKDSTSNVSTNTTHDNLVQGGVIRTDIRKSSKSIDAPYSVDSADVVYVGDIKLLSDIDVLAGSKQGASVIVQAPGLKDDELQAKLPKSFRESLAKHSIHLHVLDTSVAQDSSLEPTIAQLAFLKVALPNIDLFGVKKLAPIFGKPETLEAIYSTLADQFRETEVPESWKPSESESDSADSLQALQDLQADARPTGFVPFCKAESEDPPTLRDWQTVAKSLAFKEAYGTKSALRPELSTKTYTVRVQENRRLTPVTYDRNIFHIEFDLGDCGLKYDIGEALGIHAENSQDDVDDFVRSYGLNPDEVVEVPSKDDPATLETRTVHQALIHNIDIFGKPPKRFYESLAEFATDEKEKSQLLRLSSAEGVDEFKRRSDVDTITFADILEEFPSAHPSFHDIIKIVNPAKRREYSIASCQKVTPNSVALMIVVVDWVDPRGRKRFGQASRYLSKLKPGASVTVSVKPSVMKLPPNSTQPLIMAGLGTGLAPFRAFVQHRAMEKMQGKEVGSVLLYMGSRHQREEYCYGEEWEAYQAAGVVTLLGRAFSRDQPEKIYIQDRMRQTLPEITQAYLREQGAFYLCGPTWPVADVTAVLEEAISTEAKALGGTKRIEPSKEIEKLKEEQRYVLEVY